MIILKKNRNKVYSKLFQDGVMTAKKDAFLPKHQDLKDVSNLEVMKLMQSLTSRGYVVEKFAWQWFYWRLTDEGIEYLRQYLHLPETIVPSTFKKQTKPAGERPPRFNDQGGSDRFPRGPARDGYRGPKKMGDAPSGFNPEYERRPFGRGGFRGRGGGFARRPGSETARQTE